MITLPHLLSYSQYQSLKSHSLTCDFNDITNPIDNVTYPDINIDIPDQVRDEIVSKLCQLMKYDIDVTMMFMRMSAQGTPCPHIHHHDGSHGKYSMMLYLNDHEHGGTSLVRHIDSGITYAPINDKCVDMIVQDQNDVSAWVSYCSSSMTQNTAVIFDANLLHRAEPIGGFGETQQDARIVLTCFFS